MKIGDLVRISTGNGWCALSPDERMIEVRVKGGYDPNKFEFKRDEIGTILEVGGWNDRHRNHNVRILTPRGIGWGSMNWVEVIS